MKPKIKDLPKFDRPREKLVKYGVSKLSNSELLAILLRTGKNGKNAVELATEILQKFNSKNITDTTIDEIIKIKGLGTAKACEIIACFELGKRLLKEKKSNLYIVPDEVYKELKHIINNKKEHMYVFYLNSRNQEIEKELISVGSLNATTAHPREVFEGAIKHSASQIIIAHNHPSGDFTPSSEDITLTERFVKAGEILGIALTDHVIVSSKGYFSFRQSGLI
ncbi:MAG: DNA repair protein RadC [bacterium]|nr:DNA repair protein RadC [bacterium]